MSFGLLYQLRQLRMIVRSLSDDAIDVSSVIRVMSTGLLQRVAVRHLWRSYSTATVSTERGGTARRWCFSSRRDHITPVLVACETEN